MLINDAETAQLLKLTEKLDSLENELQTVRKDVLKNIQELRSEVENDRSNVMWRIGSIEAVIAIQHDPMLEREVAQKMPNAPRVWVSKESSIGAAAALVFRQLVNSANETMPNGEQSSSTEDSTTVDNEKREKRKIHVGLSGGNAIRAMVEALPNDINIVPYALVCPGFDEKDQISANTVIRHLCLKNHLEDSHDIPVSPLLVTHLTTAGQGEIKKWVQQTVENVDYVFTGIGGKNALDQLRSQYGITIEDDMVGDLLYCPLRKNGSAELVDEMKNKIAGVTPKELKKHLKPDKNGKKIKCVVGVAAGADKAEAVRAACRGGYINYLVIDEVLANELVK